MTRVHLVTQGTTVDRIDYDSDTATASPKGNLALDRDSQNAAGNNDFGYGVVVMMVLRV